MNLLDQIQFILFGFALVLIVLSVLALVTFSIGFIFQKTEPRSSAPDTSQASQATDKKVTTVIAAAANTVIEKPHKIISTR